MGKQKTKHVVGGSKEAAIVGSSALVGDPSHEQTYTSEDEEFQSYSKFLKGLFKKLSRWQVVLRTQGNQGDNNWQWLRVYSSSNGLDVSSKMTGEGEYPPDTVLVSGSDHWNTPEIGNVFFYWFRRGFAGENFFVDPEGKPLIEARFSPTEKDELVEFLIVADELSPAPENKSAEYSGNVSVVYQLNKHTQTLTITPQYPHHKLMSEAYQTHLFNTIDALIPGTTSPIPQPDRRARQETPTPKPLPPARRRPGR